MVSEQYRIELSQGSISVATWIVLVLLLKVYMKKIGYGITLSLQKIMYLCVMLDRGYHTLAVTRYIMKMGNSFLGNHWETIAVKNRDIQLHQLVFQLPQNVNITGDGICIA